MMIEIPRGLELVRLYTIEGLRIFFNRHSQNKDRFTVFIIGFVTALAISILRKFGK